MPPRRRPAHPAGVTVPGTRWIARRGRHAGVQIEVVKLTAGNRVVIRHLGGRGTSWSKRKSDGSGLNTLGRDQFLATYVPRAQPALEARVAAAARAAQEEPLMAKQPVVEQNGTAPNAELDGVAVEAPAPGRQGYKPRRVLSDEDVAEILRLYQDPSVRPMEIQQAYGLSAARLYGILRQQGIPTRQAQPIRPAAAAVSQAHQWTISVNVTVTRTETVAAASVDEALAKIRAELGQDVDVVLVQRTD